jgi:hypothetical protein
MKTNFGTIFLSKCRNIQRSVRRGRHKRQDLRESGFVADYRAALRENAVCVWAIISDGICYVCEDAL